MTHSEQREFFDRMRHRFPDAFRLTSVIEIGSLNINGTVRDFFQSCFFIGVDIVTGPGVDLVAHGESLDFSDGFFDVAVSAECFEHNREWAATFENMCRMAERYVFVTCASEGRLEHGIHNQHPGDSPGTHDYYRNLTEIDFRNTFNLDAMFDDYGFEYNPTSCDLYFWGCVR